MTLPINLAELASLERLAKGATPGPWMVQSHEGDDSVTAAWLCQHERWPIASGIGHCQDLAFIAAANPATVLALISHLRAAMEVAEAGRHMIVGCPRLNDDEILSMHLKKSIRAISHKLAAYDAIAGSGGEAK